MPDCLDLTPRERRRQAEATFPARLRRAVEASGLTVTAVADRAGWARRKLYDVFDGARMHSGSLWALPPEVRRLLVEDLAKSCGLEVRPAAGHAPDAATTVMVECADVIRATAVAIADGQIDPQEAATIRTEVKQAMTALAAIDSMLVEVLEHRTVARIGAA